LFPFGFPKAEGTRLKAQVLHPQTMSQQQVNVLSERQQKQAIQWDNYLK
jgi:hypothetical protein